jgi:hypothetical protein
MPKGSIYPFSEFNTTLKQHDDWLEAFIYLFAYLYYQKILTQLTLSSHTRK